MAQILVGSSRGTSKQAKKSWNKQASKQGLGPFSGVAQILVGSSGGTMEDGSHEARDPRARVESTTRQRQKSRKKLFCSDETFYPHLTAL